MKFGPNPNNPTILFDVSTQFQLTNQCKTFACQDGLMIIQQSSVNPALVNVILKPKEELKIPFGQIKYFVYRGLSKDSFISGTNITPQATGNSEFIARFWVDWNQYKISHPTLPNPGPESFGYDNSLSSSLDIEKIYDNSQANNIRPIYVKEGEWIGNFGTYSPISFEVVVDTNNIFTLDFLRTDKHQIDVTSLWGLDLRAKREQILSFIDPATFFGLHYNEGVNVSTYTETVKTTEKKKQDDLYISLISKFANKNCVYLDIRSEKGYSYNFYQNYGNASGKNIKVGSSVVTPAEGTYEWYSWPLIMINSPLSTTEDKNNIKINLRIDDNTKPILFCEDTTVLANNQSDPFIKATNILNGTTIDWSKDLDFVFPNTGTSASKDSVAYYIRLYYFRQEYNPASPNTVLQNEKYFDSAFCPIDLPNLSDESYLLCQAHNANHNFMWGEIPSLDNFSYVSRNGCYWDSSRIIFFAKTLLPNKNTIRTFNSFENKVFDTGFNLTGKINKMSFLAKNIRLTQKKIQEEITTENFQQIKLLEISNSNEIPNFYESILCLGITQAELLILKNLSGLSNLHHRYIYIEEIIGSPCTDKDGKPFLKYKLKVQGIDNNGNQAIVSPSTDIYVYSGYGIVFASKNFAEQEINQQGVIYVRNYEENIGYANREKTTNKRYEDYFIEDINPNMKIEVNGFIDTLASIDEDATNAYLNIKSLVEDSAQDIWDAAVNFVKANNNANPDDRPLYWARNKMEVALKSHPYFKGQFAGSEILVGSDLEAMVKLFEEKSRNYTGVDFSGAPPGAKKILITGFDPFQLNPKYGDNAIKTQNPSGIVALWLHGKEIQDNLGNKGFIQSAIFPVRYIDFDNNVVENLVSTFLKNNSINMIMSLSL
ncbi:MAG: hypothetical protein LBC68_03855, partial [Prevotellaceae bacterium]|nr:hypothetical protein [Prevotellaceae bacterium]